MDSNNNNNNCLFVCVVFDMEHNPGIFPDRRLCRAVGNQGTKRKLSHIEEDEEQKDTPMSGFKRRHMVYNDHLKGPTEGEDGADNSAQTAARFSWEDDIDGDVRDFLEQHCVIHKAVDGQGDDVVYLRVFDDFLLQEQQQENECTDA